MVTNNMPGDIIYHERQRRQLCALHALNNLFQSDIYTKAQLDEVCKHLSPQVWINPHRSVLGLGNYDVNVIMTALQEKNCEAVWFDKRKDPSCINPDEVVGFILNVPADYKFGIVTLPIKKRHWIAVRKIDDDGQYYNLDSKLDSPNCIGDEECLITYFRSQLESNDRELFIIVQKETASAQKWLKPTIASAEETRTLEAEAV